MNQALSNHNWQQRAITLHKKFCEYGECDGPSTSTDTITNNTSLPEALQALLSVSGEWHIMRYHYGAYGCNLFDEGAFIDKIGVFGDEEVLAEWRNEHDSPNCAEEGWECFCKVSEYDYIFVCVDITNNTSLPEALQALLSVSGEWHIMRYHYGAYGCNLFHKGAFIDKMGVFGDDKALAVWRNEHDSPNCAEEGWECFCQVSEYDYIFVCVDKGSPHYGHTRHVVNNCFDDDSFLDGPFDIFFDLLEGFADAWLKNRKADEENDDVGFIGYFYDTHRRTEGSN
eukprot:CAMPEP_0204652064 /NCGR_PEP_ID=MMETSP0718-20130828/14339_1 /ASSEMBLY_ACC=CAM_ASM_000674 /TAXON_ID=230516 /ORGANISM="Chaetoceros curvisetus" /LENGTH=283 /DNA_ID=CAMNT_0051675975 /DNA_START=105 /DNA_END=953 /DNA_ORIENTATION=-